VFTVPEGWEADACLSQVVGTVRVDITKGTIISEEYDVETPECYRLWRVDGPVPISWVHHFVLAGGATVWSMTGAPSKPYLISCAYCDFGPCSLLYARLVLRNCGPHVSVTLLILEGLNQC
jgi:hypothetical protein